MAKNTKYIEAHEKRKRALSRGESQLWKKITHDVKPLVGREPIELTQEDVLFIEEPIPTHPTHYNLKPLQTIPSDESHKSFHELSHGIAAGVDRKTMDRLRKGKMEIEGRLDLHGMTQAEAYRHLVRFIDQSYFHKKRCVNVITGKGTQLNGNIGILRQAVPQWLNQPELRSKIIAFSHAPKNEGGEGAVYVLLKRWR